MQTEGQEKYGQARGRQRDKELNRRYEQAEEKNMQRQAASRVMQMDMKKVDKHNIQASGQNVMQAGHTRSGL